jgi:hypothetical protein
MRVVPLQHVQRRQSVVVARIHIRTILCGMGQLCCMTHADTKISRPSHPAHGVTCCYTRTYPAEAPKSPRGHTSLQCAVQLGPDLSEPQGAHHCGEARARIRRQELCMLDAAPCGP